MIINSFILVLFWNWLTFPCNPSIMIFTELIHLGLEISMYDWENFDKKSIFTPIVEGVNKYIWSLPRKSRLTRKCTVLASVITEVNPLFLSDLYLRWYIMGLKVFTSAEQGAKTKIHARCIFLLLVKYIL